MQQKLLGNSIQIKELNESIKQVAPTDISVLITGESGTGKEVVANLIHAFSRRKDRPLITVNCGAIPEGIIESELFGHKKGAFTGAIEDRQGYFEMADRGTIFLDEIGDMPLLTQVKILRVLESGEFMRVGGNRIIKVNVRVIAATNKDLAKEVLEKNFREDLYFRLKSINLHIPPLRERKSDIPILIEHFSHTFCKKNSMKFHGIDDNAMQFLTNYHWAGNARELKNFIESILVLYPDREITIDDVKKHLNIAFDTERSLPVLYQNPEQEFPSIEMIMKGLAELKSDIMDIRNLLSKNEIERLLNQKSQHDFYISKQKAENMKMEDVEREFLIYTLKNNNWNVNEVSKLLEQTPRNLYHKIKKYNIQKEI